MKVKCPRIIVAGTQSGVGKTSIALGLARAFVRQGLRVQTFKVGPDFLDPTYLARASGRPCYNLDGWMCGEHYVKALCARKSAHADLALIEGVMGLFDGVYPDCLDGSTGEIAAILGAPVLLVADAHGTARSLAATVKGFAEFDARVRVAGVIANRCGSSGHRVWLAEALAGANLPPLVGGIPSGALPALRSRHLGLFTANADVLTEEHIEQLSAACREHINLEAVLRVAQIASAFECAAPDNAAPGRSRRVRLGVAHDAAFHFYYADVLEAFERAGCELVRFSPLNDERLPEMLDAVYFGGGYPEEHADSLSENRPMREAVREFCRAGRPVYAECGGLMYLGRTLQTLDGRSHEMAGVLPADTRKLARRKALRYVEVRLLEDSLWGRRGDSLRGHEFHYSELTNDPTGDGGVRRVYEVRRPRGGEAFEEGFAADSVLASYVHLHMAARQAAVEHFVRYCESRKAWVCGGLE